ncbi:MAG: NUDIX domain-containing protein [Candidatus Aenigmarchaeota archaeon]|nr:NUDIX domain-containing protein [Candidatus Aenigmarchaeota archaeon]
MVLGEKVKEIIVAGPVIVESEKLLVILDEQGYYKTPGGKKEKNETMEETVKREALEEVGAQTEVKEVFSEHFVTRGEKNYHLFNLRSELKTRPKMTQEIKEFRWISYEDSKKLNLSSNVKELIDLLHKGGEM